MTALDALLVASGNTGGTIHQYERAFGQSLTGYGPAEFSALAMSLRDQLETASDSERLIDLIELASRASVAHLILSGRNGMRNAGAPTPEQAQRCNRWIA